jgi:hypothetical protein
MTEENFRRLTGVKKKTFEKMVEIVGEAHRQKKLRGGRKNKLSVEEMVYLTLEYLREYTTYLRIGKNYGISESYACKTIRWVENILVKSGIFSLPGKKALEKSNVEYEVILIDATETPIERPKKKEAKK